MPCEHPYFLRVYERSFLLLQCNFLYHYIHTLSKNHCYLSITIFSVFSDGLCASSMQFSLSLSLHFEQNHCHVSIPIFSVFAKGLSASSMQFSLSLYLDFEQNHCYVSILFSQCLPTVLSPSSMEFSLSLYLYFEQKSLLCEHPYFVSVHERSFPLLQCNFLGHNIHTLSKNHCYLSITTFSVFSNGLSATSMQFSLSLYLHFEQNHCHVSIPIFSVFTNGLFCFFNAISSVTMSTL